MNEKITAAIAAAEAPPERFEFRIARQDAPERLMAVNVPVDVTEGEILALVAAIAGGLRGQIAAQRPTPRSRILVPVR